MGSSCSVCKPCNWRNRLRRLQTDTVQPVPRNGGGHGSCARRAGEPRVGADAQDSALLRVRGGDEMGCVGAGVDVLNLELPEGKTAKYAVSEMRNRWSDAGVDSAPLLIRALSGQPVLSMDDVIPGTPMSSVVADICAETGAFADEVRLVAGASVVDHDAQLGDCAFPAEGGPVEMSFIYVPGPPVSAETTSGSEIEVLDGLPPAPCRRCHNDRGYRFTSLGAFEHMPNVRYVLTPNADKSMPCSEVMWTLDIRVPAKVHLNFRGVRHVTQTGAADWLAKDGWTVSDLQSTVSSGTPNGPYSGPVYSKQVNREVVELMGSDCWEGVYFVFVELEDS